MNWDLVQHFRRFHDHRTGVLEGVRAVAFRNVDHLSRAMEHAGINKFTSEKSVARVQDAIIREQGLQPTATQRWLLGCGLSNAWEVYLCLLLAEVESYRSMRISFALTPLDELLDGNASVLEALKILRDKLLHPTKDVLYEETLTRYFREVEDRYPLHLLFAKHLQTLLDQYLRELKDHLFNSFVDEVARQPDNQLQAFLTREERDLTRGLARATDDFDKKAVEKLLREHQELAISMKVDPAKRDAPLHKRQWKKVQQLLDLKRLLLVTPMPKSDYHSPTTVQAPMHETLSSYVPIPPTPDAQDFYRGAHLPSPLDRSRDDYAALVFRSALLLSESLHYADAQLQKLFPGKSRSEIRALDDWTTRFPAPVTPEDIAIARSESSPGMVALALLADPLREYRRAVATNPTLRVPELRRIATNAKATHLAALRNIVFHVPDARVRNPYRVEVKFLATVTDDYHQKLISGLWRFFLRGDQLSAYPITTAN